MQLSSDAGDCCADDADIHEPAQTPRVVIWFLTRQGYELVTFLKLKYTRTKKHD